MWIKTFLILTGVLILAGVSIVMAMRTAIAPEPIPTEYLLGVATKDILSSKLISKNVCKEWEDQIVNGSTTSRCVRFEKVDTVKYWYISDAKVQRAKYEGLNENISKRTKNSQHFETTLADGRPGEIIRFYIEERFHKKNNEWYEIKAKSMPQKYFKRQTSKGIWDLFGRSALAATFNVSAIDEDAIERSDDNYFNVNGFKIGRSGTGDFWYAAAMFPDVTVAQGSSVSAAKVTLTSEENNTFDASTVNITANDVDDAVDFTANADIVNRAATSANVDWSAPTSVILDEEYDTSDIATVVEAILGRASWSSGNAMMIFFKPTVRTIGDDWEIYDYDADSAKAPVLTITVVSVVEAVVPAMIWF